MEGLIREDILMISLVIVFSLFSIITVIPMNIWSYELTMTVDGMNINFGQISPLRGPVIIPHATQIVVVSETLSWDLIVDIPDNLINTSDPTKNIPITQLHWATHSTTPVWTAFTVGTQALLTAQSPTSAEGKIIDLDYKLDVSWANIPGSYHGTITYSITAGGLDTSFATPNPFSPNGDLVNDTTTIHYCLETNGTITATILDVNDVIIKTLFADTALLAGTHSVTWDGKDDSNVVVADGDYKYLIKETTAGVITSGIITVDCGTVTGGTGVIEGEVIDAVDNTPLAGATVTLYEVSGNFISETISDVDGKYMFSGLLEGYYYLKAEMASYYTEITENIYVAAAGTTTKTIYMTHNTSLFVIKCVNNKNTQIGDILSYTVIIRNIGHGNIMDITIKDKLPYDFKYISGSAIMNNIPCEPYDNGILIWHVDKLSEGGSITLSYNVIIGVDAGTGIKENTVVVTGTDEHGEYVSSRDVIAEVRVREGLFAHRGIIVGKVYEDKNHDGIQQSDEYGLSGVKLLMEDGTMVVTDEYGRYSIPAVTSGIHIMTVDKSTIPFDAILSPQYLYVPEGGIVDVDFGVVKSSDNTVVDMDERFVIIALAYGEANGFIVTGDKDSFISATSKFPSKIYIHGRIAVYLKGKIKGKYLITCIADTDKKDIEEIISNIDPDMYYPVYGDNSKILTEPYSYGQLYVCVEKDNTSGMYGNYSIDIDNTILGTYHRSLNGVKLTHDRKVYRAEIFAASNRRVCIYQEIPGRDICGPYYLEKIPAIPGSEKIRIEVRNKNTEAILLVIPKQKDKDYIIDYDKGIIIFDKPVSGEDSGGIYHCIVVIYEHLPVSKTRYINWGVKGEVKVNDTVDTRMYYISEEHGFGKKLLYGMRFNMDIMDRLKINGEYANTDGEVEPVSEYWDTSAYLLEAQLRLNQSAYMKYFYRYIGNGFTNKIDTKMITQKDVNLFQYAPGFYDLTQFIPHKDAVEYGMSIDWKISNNVYASIQQKQVRDNVVNNPERATAYTKITAMSIQHKNSHNTSVFLNCQYKISDNNKTLTTPDVYTNGITVGMQTKKERFRMGTKYEYADTKNYTTGMNTYAHGVSFNTELHYDPVLLSIGYDFNISRKHNRIMTKQETFRVGLLGNYNLFSSLRLNVQSQFVCNANHITRKFTQELINTFIASYTPYDGLSSCIRYEIKRGVCPGEMFGGILCIDIEKNITKALTGYIKYRYTYTKADTDSDKDNNRSSTSDGCFALAYRAVDTNNLNILAKYNIQEKNKTLVSLSATCKPVQRLVTACKYAIRHVKEKTYTSCVDMLLARVTYELTDKMNITGQHRIIHQHMTNTYKMSPSVEIGYKINNVLQVVLGYNFIEYTDGDELLNGYTARGGYIRIIGGLIQQ
jgi:uncharacterized repeat protein (TIGR01451 family)